METLIGVGVLMFGQGILLLGIAALWHVYYNQ